MRIFKPLLCAAICLAAAAARAEVALSPLRQVLTEEAPLATYRVSNPSARIIDGRVSWIDLAATKDGYRQARPEDRERLSAAPYLTVWPAFFRLEPGASVTISVALKKGARPPHGERRSHLLIETDAARTPLRKAGGSLEVDIGLGISTPVILRSGEIQARAAIGDTRLLRRRDGLLELETHIEPKNEISAYGCIDVIFTPKNGDAPQRLARIDNVAAYVDAPSRRVTAPLGLERLAAGVLEIRYEGRAEFDGITFAARAFEIAPPK